MLARDPGLLLSSHVAACYVLAGLLKLLNDQLCRPPEQRCVRNKRFRGIASRHGIGKGSTVKRSMAKNFKVDVRPDAAGNIPVSEKADAHVLAFKK